MSHPPSRIISPRGVLAVSALALIVVAMPRVALAEVVVMRSGSRIACSRAVTETSRVRLELAGGGVLHVALDDVKRIESGTGSGSQALLVRSSLGAGGGDAADAFGSRGRSLQSPVSPEVATTRAASAEPSASSPTIVGSQVGVAPVPMSPQLRSPALAPTLDARRQAFAQRARISPGSAGGLLSRATPGALGSGGSSQLDGLTGRDAPRVPR